MGFEGWKAGRGWMERGRGWEWSWLRLGLFFFLGLAGLVGVGSVDFDGVAFSDLDGVDSSDFAGEALKIGRMDILRGQRRCGQIVTTSICALIQIS